MKIQTNQTALSALMLLCLLFTSAHAVTLYKWVDADGKVTYQDQPPPSGQEFEEQEVDLPVITPTEATENEMADAARSNPVTLYSVPNCDSCELASLFLEKNKVPFNIKNVENSAETQATLKSLTGSLRVPVVTVGNDVVNGFNRSQLLSTLEENAFPISKEAQLDSL